MKTGEIHRMAGLESSHWWYQTLHQKVHRVLVQQGVSKQAKILDLACGSGGLMKYLHTKGYQYLVGIDLSPTAINLCKEKQLKVAIGDIKDFEKVIGQQQFDVIICNDALYFLEPEEQQQFLQQVNASLLPNGIVILNVPALNLFKGNHDLTVGIKQRLNKKDLNTLLLHLPFQKTEQRYWPVLLSPIILFVRTKQRLIRDGMAQSDLYPLNPLLNRILYTINKFEMELSFIDGMGSSLFTVIKKLDR